MCFLMAAFAVIPVHRSAALVYYLKIDGHLEAALAWKS